MRLRTAGLLITLALGILAVPLAADAEQSGKVPRIGVLGPTSEGGTYIYALREGLRELGYVEGRNIAFEWRWAQGRAERFPDLAAELVRIKVDVIVAGGDPPILAAQKATKTIPIVMVITTNPVALGFVASLARPGGNITGLTTQSAELAGKRVQLLKEAVPNLSRLVVLWASAEPGRRELARETEVAAPVLGMQPRLLGVQSLDELDSAFTAMAREGADAVAIGGSALFNTHRARVAELAAKSRLPTVCAAREYVEVGCLMSYGASFSGNARRAAYFVDRILKGAKPADLPVEQPTRFELVVNLKTAKALGLTIPQFILLQATEVIQ